MADDTPALQDIPRPRPAIPSFMFRLFAFLIDVVLLYFLGYTLNTIAREPLMRLGPALPLLGSLAGFAYFWLADSPLGGGSTLGKGIVNIRVVNAFAEPIGWGASLRRALLKFPWVFPALFQFIAEIAGLPIRPAYFIHTLLMIGCQIILFTLTCMVVTEPFRRGWHDFWAGSFVTSSPPPDEFTRRITEPDAQELGRSETTRKLSVALMIVVGLIMVATWIFGLFKSELTRDLNLRQTVIEMDPLPGFRLDSVELPKPGDEEKFLRGVARARSMTPAGQDPPTTDSLRRLWVADGHTAIMQFTTRAGDLTRERVESPEFKAGLERLRTEWPRLMEGAVKQRDNVARVDTLAVATVGLFHFFLLPHRSEHVLLARIPLNPAEEIETQWINIEEEEKKAREKSQPPAPTPGGAGQAPGQATSTETVPTTETQTR